jgi:hypothetical protein
MFVFWAELLHIIFLVNELKIESGVFYGGYLKPF